MVRYNSIFTAMQGEARKSRKQAAKKRKEKKDIDMTFTVKRGGAEVLLHRFFAEQHTSCDEGEFMQSDELPSRPRPSLSQTNATQCVGLDYIYRVEGVGGTDWRASLIFVPDSGSRAQTEMQRRHGTARLRKA